MKEKDTYSAIDSKIGRNMRAIRHLAGLTQQDAAKALGVTYQQVQKYEQGVNRLSCPMLHRLAQFYGVPYSYFFDGVRVEDEAADIAGYDDLTLKICGRLAGIEDVALRQKIGRIVEILAA